jgi:hypothetical protein
LSAGAGRVLGGDVASDHQLDDFGGRAGALVERLDMPAVAEHRGPVGQRIDLVHAMRDVENGHALRLQAREQRIDFLDVGAGQGRSRFVENEELGFLAERLGDLDHLAARQRQIAHAQQRIDVFAADFGEQRLRAASLRAGVDHAEPLRRRRYRNIVGDRQVRHQGKFLKDADDAGRGRGGGIVELARNSIQMNLAGIRLHHAGDDLDQRRLAGAVFAEHGVDLPARAAEIDRLQRAHAAVAF